MNEKICSQLINNWINGNKTITYINKIKISSTVNYVEFSDNYLRFYHVNGIKSYELIEISILDIKSIEFYIATIDDAGILANYQDEFNMNERLNENQMNCLIIKKDKDEFIYEFKLRSDEKEDYEKANIKNNG